MKKLVVLFTMLLGMFLIMGCSSSDNIDTASDEVSGTAADSVQEEPVDEVEETLDDELLDEDDDVEIGELI